MRRLKISGYIAYSLCLRFLYLAAFKLTASLLLFSKFSLKIIGNKTFFEIGYFNCSNTATCSSRKYRALRTPEANACGVRKHHSFRSISRFISEMIHDRAIVTVTIFDQYVDLSRK